MDWTAKAVFTIFKHIDFCLEIIIFAVIPLINSAIEIVPAELRKDTLLIWWEGKS